MTFAYNTRNLVTGMSYNDSGATPSVSYGYDVFGARTTMTDGEGTMTYHYNSYRQLDYETRTFTGLTGQSFTLNYTYNKADQLTRVNYVTSSGFNKNINYAHNSLGGLTGVGTNLIGTDPNAAGNVVSGMTYNGYGGLKTLNYGNGRRLTQGYNVNRHQMTSMVVDNQNGTDAIINKTYNYTSGTIDPNTGQPVNDNDGRIKKITDSVDTTYTTTYSYDEFNRLTRAQATAYDRLYNYDRFGNLTQISSAPGVVQQMFNLVQGTGGYPLNNRLANVNGNVTYGYDASGNVTQEGSTTYSYDAVNHLKEVGTGGLNVYRYDGNGMRVKKTEGGSTIFYVRSSVIGQAVIEVTASGISRAYVYVDDVVVAEQAADGQFYWVSKDHLGSGRKLTSTSGAVMYRGEFDPYGQVLLETGSTLLNSHKYTGYERDEATGLDYANARMFTSARGRFTQPDPSGLGAANQAIPQSLNRYSYVSNDPINFYDPDGLIKCGDISVAGGGTVNTYLRDSGDYGRLVRLVWHEGGTVNENGGADVLLVSDWLIAQAVINRFDIANGRVAVTGADGNTYFGSGGNGVHPASELGYGKLGTSLTGIIINAAAGTTAIDSNGEITNMAVLQHDLDEEQGDVSRAGLPNRTPVYNPVSQNYFYVTNECYKSIAALQGTNNVLSGHTLNTPDLFVTSWKKDKNSNPDSIRLYDFGTNGQTRFWGVQLYSYSFSIPRGRPSNPTSPPNRNPGGRKVI